MNIYDILKDSAYKTKQFANEAIAKLNEKIVVKLYHIEDFCRYRNYEKYCNLSKNVL